MRRLRTLVNPRPIAALAAVATLAGSVGVALLDRRPAELSGNLGRFAALTFGSDAARGALAATSSAGEAEDEARIAPPSVPDAPEEDPDVPETPLTFTEYRTPNGWRLRPAGRQVDTARAPTGLAVSPDAKTVVVVSSGIFNEDMTLVDASTLAATSYPSADLYMGAALDPDGNLWVSTGSRNRVYQYRLVGTAPAGVRQGTPLVPQGAASTGIPVIGYPGNMALGSDGRLYVAGNLSVPSSFIASKQPGTACKDSTICSVVNVIDVSNRLSPSPAVRYVPVGRDAYGVALNTGAGKLYVTNWADETNVGRAGGTGTVSVVNVSTPGAEAEVQVVPVGHHPTGLALSPDGGTLFVANSADDSLSKISLDAQGLPTGPPATISVRTTPDAPRGARPLALGFSADGRYLLVGLAGQNAVEVRTAAGEAIPRTVSVRGWPVNVPHTYVPTGWYPSALASAPHPAETGKTRLYVTNLKGVGAGPGGNFQAQPFSGVRTQGTLSVVDLDDGRFDEWTATVVENNDWATLFGVQTSDAAADPCFAAPLPGGKTAFSQFLCDESKAAGPSPYHVVYIVKENKTFDQFFGDIRAFGVLDADADPTFLLYGQPVTTNQHEIARLFTIGDGFWADSEQSTTGHSWTSAGYATEYNEITWNPDYSQGFRGQRRAGIYEGQYIVTGNFSTTPIKRDSEIAEQEGELFEPEERLVDLLADPVANPRGATFRIYSDDVEEGSPAVQQRFPLGLWGLGAQTPHGGGDLEFPDTDRARIFNGGRTVVNAWNLTRGRPPAAFGKEIGLCGAPDDPAIDNAPESFCQRPGASPDEYGRFSLAAWTTKYHTCMAQPGATDAQCQREMPNFIYMVLPVDHTLGFNPLAPTPASMVADNDYAYGLVVEALSESPFWKNTLVLATEDDTQLAGDHVDSHRTFLLAAGGLARRHGPDGRASHQPGSLPSILKTVEVLFGLEPFTIYDRAAVPLHDFVVNDPADANSVVYEAVRPPTPFLRNPAEGDLATLSMMLDWRLDMTDPDLLTALFYYGEKGWPLPERYRKLLGR